mmetsp:Transcript_7669/g.16871  ORF Transcript_7669/g.16871 Transcript_7669/m.16871 type:complete len:86 (-) Transcript_7669:969-1226(-)
MTFITAALWCGSMLTDSAQSCTGTRMEAESSESAISFHPLVRRQPAEQLCPLPWAPRQQPKRRETFGIGISSSIHSTVPSMRSGR